MTPNPIALHLGPLEIRWYGLLILTGAILGAFVATQEAKRKGENPDIVWDALLWVLPTGLLGARLYHVASAWDLYKDDLLRIVTDWRGLGIYGAIAGGFLALWLYCRLNKQNLVRWLDIGAPGIILAQAIGRWGNFFNQELYGKPTDLPWAIYIDPAHRLPGYEQFERFHPTFLYESLWNLTMCLLLLWVARRYTHWLLEGDVFLLYIAFYGVGRAWVQTLRLDQWIVGQSIPFEQVLPAALALLAGIGILLRHYVLPRKGAGGASPPGQGVEAAVEEPGKE